MPTFPRRCQRGRADACCDRRRAGPGRPGGRDAAGDTRHGGGTDGAGRPLPNVGVVRLRSGADPRRNAEPAVRRRWANGHWQLRPCRQRPDRARQHTAARQALRGEHHRDRDRDPAGRRRRRSARRLSAACSRPGHGAFGWRRCSGEAGNCRDVVVPERMHRAGQALDLQGGGQARAPAPDHGGIRHGVAGQRRAVRVARQADEEGAGGAAPCCPRQGRPRRDREDAGRRRAPVHPSASRSARAERNRHAVAGV
jgi:hypothetical protein